MKNLVLSLAMVMCIYSSAQNYALSFNATNKYVSIPDHNSLDLSSSFTIEGWIYPVGPGSSGTDGGIIINKEYSYEIALFPDYTLRYALSANGTGSDWSWINTGISVPQNSWNHFAMVKSGTSVTFFFNGVQQFTNSSAPSTLTANAQEIRIGARILAPQYFNGYIDEIRIWNTARTANELRRYILNKDLSNSASGLVAYYRFNENSGTTTENSCTNTSGINGTLVNSPAWVSSPVQYGANSLQFDGTDDVVTIANQASLNITSAITLEAWVYATKNTGVQNVVSKSSNSQNTGYIFPRTDNGWTNTIVYLHIGGSWRTVSASFPSLNNWHHLAATYDGAAIRLYINGILSATQSQSGVIATNTNSLTIGDQPGFSEFFGGRVDEIRVWNIARTQSEIQNNMNTELDPALQTGLVAYYNFNQGSADGSNTGLNRLIDRMGTHTGTLSNFTLSGASSNFKPQFSGLGTLPVQWLYFRGIPHQHYNKLSWATASESRTRDFNIEHSHNGNTWRVIGTKSAAGFSQETRIYEFLHQNPATGINHYRLRQNDEDGRFSYSSIIQLRNQRIDQKLSLHPNPTQGVVFLQTEVDGWVSIYDASGRQLLRTWHSGRQLQLDLRFLPKGLYHVQFGLRSSSLLIR